MNRLQQVENHGLEGRLLVAHQQGDRGELVRLYGMAADISEEKHQIEAACYFLTIAYVFALERGDEQAPVLHERLVFHGREE